MLKDQNELTILGSKIGIPKSPDDAVLETFDNAHQGHLYLVPFVMPRDEFTSLCPKTGQPDTARIELVYVPRVKMIESKALKLYLASFRNQGEFHENVANRIFNDLWNVMNPYFMRVYMDFTPRGTLAIKPLIMRFDDDAHIEKIKTLLENWDRLR